MHVETYLNGILPRSDQALKLGSAWLKGRETKENFHDLLRKETQEYIELQQNLGLNYVIDGQLFWNDFLRPIAKALDLHRENSNSDENPVTRQIYTNTFYRKPFFQGRLNNFSPELTNGTFFDLVQKNKRKLIFPSPFSLLYLSDGIHRNEDGTIKKDVFIELLMDAARILNHDAKRLQDNHNISFIQFNEPCMAYAEETREFWNEIVESVNLATKDLKIVTSLHLYNGDVSKFFPDILNFNVDRIGIDAYSTNLSKFSDKKFEKFLEIGIVNSKNSSIEKPETLAKYASQVNDKIKPNGLALVPNRPLELVTQQIAKRKIESLAKAAEILNSK